MSSGAAVCPHCGKRRTSATTKGCLWIVIVVGVLMVFAFNSGTDRPASTPAPSTATEAAPVMSSPTLPTWNYYASSDSMTSKRSMAADLESSNTASFSFPYAGPQHATLMIRQHPRYGRDVIFMIERGQFGCGFDGCPILVRFDDGSPERFTGHEPSDHGTTSVFITPVDRFYSRIQKAKTVRIESTFFQEGAQVFTFNAAGFDPKRFAAGG